MQPHKNSFIPDEYVYRLNLSGLNGRYLRIPNKTRKREILLVYGQHSSLERYYGFAEDLSQYGTVTMPDIPGFGGMDSLYKVDEVASIDAMADYLAAVVTLLYKKRRITIAGFSIGSAIVTRMLQKYPDITKRTDLVVSVAGASRHSDFKFSPRLKKFYKLFAMLFCGAWRARFFRYFALNRLVLLSVYRFMPNARHKFVDMDDQTFKKMIRFEIELWHANDVHTYFKSSLELLTFDLTKEKVPLPVHHISLGAADQYFDNKSVAKNMRSIFKSYKVYNAKMKQHMPSVIASKLETEPLIPPDIRRMLARAPKKA